MGCILWVPYLVQRQVGGDDQRLPAAVAAVYDVVDPLDAGCAIASLKVDRRFIKIWRKGRGFSCKKYGFMIRLL